MFNLAPPSALVEINPESALWNGLLEDPTKVLAEQLTPWEPSDSLHCDREKSLAVKRLDEHCAKGRHPELD